MIIYSPGDKNFILNFGMFLMNCSRGCTLNKKQIEDLTVANWGRVSSERGEKCSDETFTQPIASEPKSDCSDNEFKPSDRKYPVLDQCKEQSSLSPINHRFLQEFINISAIKPEKLPLSAAHPLFQFQKYDILNPCLHFMFASEHLTALLNSNVLISSKIFEVLKQLMSHINESSSLCDEQLHGDEEHLVKYIYKNFAYINKLQKCLLNHNGVMSEENDHPLYDILNLLISDLDKEEMPHLIHNITFKPYAMKYCKLCGQIYDFKDKDFYIPIIQLDMQVAKSLEYCVNCCFLELGSYISLDKDMLDCCNPREFQSRYIGYSPGNMLVFELEKWSYTEDSIDEKTKQADVRPFPLLMEVRGKIFQLKALFLEGSDTLFPYSTVILYDMGNWYLQHNESRWPVLDLNFFLNSKKCYTKYALYDLIVSVE